MPSNVDPQTTSPLVRLKLNGELARIKVGLKGAANALARLKQVARANQIRMQLGAVAAPTGDDGLSDDPNSPNYRYRDTGYIADSRKEKAASQIADARKSGQRLRASDIDFDAIEQNPRQASELVTKANLFGKTDWQALKDGGMEPGAGFLIDKIYASIAPTPDPNTADTRRDYAIGLESIRDRLQSVKTVDDVLGVLDEIRDELDGTTLLSDETEQYELLGEQETEKTADILRLRGQVHEIDALVRQAKIDLSAVEHSIKQRAQRGEGLSDEYLRAHTDAQAKVDTLTAQFEAIKQEIAPRISALKKEREAIWDERLDIMREAKKRNAVENQATRSWRTFGDRFMKLLFYRYVGGSKPFNTYAHNAKLGRIADWSWSDKERSSTPRGTTSSEINFQLRVADQFERRGGTPVSVNSTQTLKEMLGLRDVQSGNWVLKDPASAKFHVEQTAGAMSDMADMLGIEVSALGLGGRLGMAFGARGTGGKNAARAHYEPVHRVINLTKMGGGGSLGHEVFHAIDNILHELVNQKVGGGKKDFVTTNPDLLPPGEIRDAVVELRGALLDGNVRLPERITFSDSDIRMAHANIDEPRNSIAQAIKEAGSAQAAVLAVDEFFGTSSNRRIEKNRKEWRKLAAAFYAKAGETMAQLDTGRPVSSFAREAAVLDGGVEGKYWSSTEEMAARAFQSWLEDRLASEDRRNDYLSVYADNKYHTDPDSDKGWKPYPDGDERTRINQAFDRMFAAIRDAKVFEKAAGNTALLDAIFGEANGDVLLFADAVLDRAGENTLEPVFTEYANDPEGAIERLLKEKKGSAHAVWKRQGLGTIDLVYGDARTGLAHIAQKHPQMLTKLPELIKRGKIVRKSGANKVFIVSDGKPPQVAVIALDWYGRTKAWVVTGYEDERGVFTGGLKTIDTGALDSASVVVLDADQRTVASLQQTRADFNDKNG